MSRLPLDLPRINRRVMNRSSAQETPNLMFVSADELRTILINHLRLAGLEAATRQQMYEA